MHYSHWLMTKPLLIDSSDSLFGLLEFPTGLSVAKRNIEVYFHKLYVLFCSGLEPAKEY